MLIKIFKKWTLKSFFIVFTLFISLKEVFSEPSLTSINSYGYLLQNISINELENSSFDLLIIDYSKDGTESLALSTEEINKIQVSKKKVLAYLSIGEAEDYRYYFKKIWFKKNARKPCGIELSKHAPSWLDKPNKNWCGNYKVKFWDKAWKKIIYGRKSGSKKSYLDKIIDIGFDGVYLDIIDGYDYWQNQTGKRKRKTAAKDMAQFVIKLGQYARNTRNKPDFIIIPQNGAEIINKIPLELKTLYFSSIQAIGAEDSFFFGDADENNPYQPQPVLNILDQYLKAGKKVFAIDYLTDSQKIETFQSLACERGFLPQVGKRALDSLLAETITGCIR